WLVAVAGFEAGAVFAGGEFFVVAVLPDSVLAADAFAGAAFVAGFVAVLAVAAAFAGGAFLAGLAAAFAVAALPAALPCPSPPAAGFEAALAGAF
ncbi:hypothetical protein, partial [Mesorhizobium sp. M2D.F.Ca.ET.206.01.1.1]|uniref:hypothetical protein n=1 Tax=Mesorhizobium sp. M2D.F.Ca.ET.206.01.1.1 TaxID=2563939 RepID=UPI00167BB41B